MNTETPDWLGGRVQCSSGGGGWGLCSSVAGRRSRSAVLIAHHLTSEPTGAADECVCQCESARKRTGSVVSIVPCMMPRYAFLHAADLRLDAPFSGIGRTPPLVAAALRDASLQAWDALVDTAIARRVAAVMLSGGLADGLERGARAQVRLQRGVARLVEHGIAVFIAVGGRDPRDGFAAIGDWPEGVVVFA